MDWERPQFTAATVTEASGVPQHKIRQWTQLGLFAPDGQRRGKGYKTLYSARNVLQLMIMRRLSEKGVALVTVQQFYTNLQEWMELWSRDYTEIREGWGWLYASLDGAEVTDDIEKTKDWPDFIGINLSDCISDILADLK